IRESTAAMRRRFEQEIATLARLQHPGIGAIYSSGTDGERLYFAMELVAGERLDRHAARLSDARKLALLPPVADAVHHAHVKGVIHRDLKPANILVDGEQPKVLDFGIARLIDVPLEERATMTGVLVGTPAYMSPEQATFGEADARSDVYALGLIGYELPAGRLPSPRGGSLDELLFSIRDGRITPIGEVRPALRGDVEVMLGRALAADPEARYPSAAAFADDIRR